MDTAREPCALGVAMALVLVMAVLVGTGVWVAVRLEGHMDTPATLARQSERRHGPPAAHKADTGHVGSGHVGAGRNVRCRCRDNPAHRRAGVR
jgi:L-aminopeptidase/D-esterase-like protein